MTAGCLWMGMNWLLDAAMFSHGPMKMTLAHYVTEIGPAYLIIPVITTGLGAAASWESRRSKSSASSPNARYNTAP